MSLFDRRDDRRKSDERIVYQNKDTICTLFT